jgi:hypothetical protein
MKDKSKGQLIYMGPHAGFIGLYYGKLWRDGIDKHLHEWIKRCPAIGELIVPVSECAIARKSLAFDYAHNMRGTSGRYVTFYREVEKWLAKQQQKQPTPSGVTIEQPSHA